MRLDVYKFETEWFDVIVGLSVDEIDALVGNLLRMKQDGSHFFHLQSRFESDRSSISNLTFSRSHEGEQANADMYPWP